MPPSLTLKQFFDVNIISPFINTKANLPPNGVSMLACFA